MKENTKKTLIIVSIIVVATLVAVAIILTTTNIKRGSSGNHYDFECLTKPIEQPLKDCRE